MPKLIGSYEQELHPLLEDAAKTDYDVVFNVGCAEGYYAVGLALRMKRAKRVLAFDINPRALIVTARVAAENEVRDRVDCFPECTHETFRAAAGMKALVFCDIEGKEVELLDPSRSPWLATYDIIVELHDGSGPPLIKDLLLSRFGDTHTCFSVKYSPRKPEDIGSLSAHIPKRLWGVIVEESRKRGLEWLALKVR